MKIKNIILSLAMLFVLVGCFKDKGNYDYNSMPEIKVSIPSLPQTVVGSEIEIKAKITLPEGYNTTFTYEWEDEHSPIEGGDSVLIYKVNTLGVYYISLTITDVKTKAKHVGYSSVMAIPLFKNGFLVLAEDGENSDMHFIPSALIGGDSNSPTTNDSIVFTKEYPYIFKNTIMQTITGKPVNIVEHFLYEAYDITNEIIITTESAGKRDIVALNGETLKPEVYIKDEFANSTLPNNFNPKKIIHTALDSYIVNEDNYVYPRRSASNQAYHVGNFDKDLRLWGKGQITDILKPYYSKCASLLALEIDPVTKERNYVGIYEEYSSDTYNQTRLPQQNPHPDFLNVKEEVIFDDYFKNYNISRVGEGAIILKNSAGEFILHIYKYNTIRPTNINFIKSKKVNLTQEYGVTNVTDMFTSKVQDYRALYFSDDNSLYCYESFDADEQNKLTKMATYSDKKIVAIGGHTHVRAYEEDTTKEPHIAIGFNDGSFEINMLHFNNPAIIMNKVFQNTENYGKIVKIIHKEGANQFFESAY